MARIGRNDPCPCGSGKKYKRCCLRTNASKDRKQLRLREARGRTREDPARTEGVRDVERLGAAWSKALTDLPDLDADDTGDVTAVIEALLRLEEFSRQQPEIEAALEEMEPHFGAYERLSKDYGAFMARADALFAESTFAPMRFTAADLDRVFQSIGGPAAPGNEDRIVFLGKVLESLLDEERRLALSCRLLSLLPTYVADERYVDAWIIERNAAHLCAPQEGVYGPFLLCMFRFGMQNWEMARDQEEEALYGVLGIDPQQLALANGREPGNLPETLPIGPQSVAAMEDFLAAHPALAERMQAECRQAEDAALELLQSADGKCLLLDGDELAPWLPVFVEQLVADDNIAEAARSGASPSDESLGLFVDIMYSTSATMAGEVFTQSRRQQLLRQIEALGRKLRREGRDNPLALSGAAVAASPGGGDSEDNHFLTTLCLLSARQALHAFTTDADAD